MHSGSLLSSTRYSVTQPWQSTAATNRGAGQKEKAVGRRESEPGQGSSVLPAAASGPTHVQILGVDYLHQALENGDDLYVTRYGVPFSESLRPENWYDREWFEQNRQRLPGSSTVYKARTKPVDGRSREVVVKWSRVGQDVPVDTMTSHEYGEFNSPFEEFALVMEMRDTRHESPGMIRTHKPLAIYCPARRVELWRTGRKEHKFERKRVKHHDVQLDAYRHYVMIYEWIKGVDITESRLDAEAIERLTLEVEEDVRLKGFRVADRKPHHIIVRIGPDQLPLKDHQGDVPYALVDFELLQRTPERERRVEHDKRALYLVHQRDRLQAPEEQKFPAYLHQMTIFGVPYIYGHAESTRGLLWVVGLYPDLFDYFLPERWMWTPRDRLSGTHKVYHTKTKDDVHLVWKISRVGETPAGNPRYPHCTEPLTHGYNSPFEEFSFAMELMRGKINTIYPRAIYMAEPQLERPEYNVDERRYDSHSHIVTPDNKPILSRNSNYICVWGYWNGPDERLAVADGDFVSGLNLDEACRQGILGEDELGELLARKRRKLERAGFEDLNLKADHVLVSLDSRGDIIRDAAGQIELRVCNLDLVRRLPANARQPRPRGVH